MKPIDIQLPDKKYPRMTVRRNSFYEESEPSKWIKPRGGSYYGIGALLAGESAKAIVPSALEENKTESD